MRRKCKVYSKPMQWSMNAMRLTVLFVWDMWVRTFGEMLRTKRTRTHTWVFAMPPFDKQRAAERIVIVWAESFVHWVMGLNTITVYLCKWGIHWCLLYWYSLHGHGIAGIIRSYKAAAQTTDTDEEMCSPEPYTSGKFRRLSLTHLPDRALCLPSFCDSL